MRADLKVATFACEPSYKDRSAVQNVVRRALEMLGLSADFIRPGESVVLKPNWVKEHDERNPGPNQWEHVVTHPSVIEAVAAWFGERLQGRGRIVICDAPQTDSSFQKISEYCALPEMLSRLRAQFPGIDIQIIDLRPEEWHAVDGVVVSKKKQPGDP